MTILNIFAIYLIAGTAIGLIVGQMVPPDEYDE